MSNEQNDSQAAYADWKAPTNDKCEDERIEFNKDRIIEYVECFISDADHEIEAAQSESAKRHAQDKFDRFSNMLKVFQSTDSDNMSAQEYLIFLDQLHDQKQSLLNSNSSEEQWEEVENLAQAVKFLENDVKDPQTGNGMIARHKHSSVESMGTEIPQPGEAEVKSPQQEESGRNQELVENDLLDLILEKGAAKIHTSLPSSEHPSGSAGFVDRIDSKLLQSVRSNIIGELSYLIGTNNAFSKHPESKGLNADHALANKGITEIFYMVPIQKDIYETQTTYVKQETGGVLGFGKKQIEVPQSKQVLVGHQPVASQEMIQKGDDEPCYRVLYSTTNNADDGKFHNTYQDYSNRSGQLFSMELILPESIARQVYNLAKDNPNFLHSLVDMVALKDLGINENTWYKGENNSGHPLRPPYEKWKEITGSSKAYILQESDIKDQLEAGTPDFDEKFVVNF